MKLIVEKGDLSWAAKNGFLGQEQVFICSHVSFILAKAGILWEQLQQKCSVKDGFSSSTTSVQTKKDQNIAQPQGSYLGKPKTCDICIAYSFHNGLNLARLVIR